MAMAEEQVGQSRKEILIRLAALAGALSPDDLLHANGRSVLDLERALCIRYPTVSSMSQDQLRVLLDRASAPVAPARKRKAGTGEDTTQAAAPAPSVEVTLPAPEQGAQTQAEPALAGEARGWASEPWGISPPSEPRESSTAPAPRGGADLQAKLDAANAKIDALSTRLEQMEGLVERTYQLTSGISGMVEALGQGLAGVEALASGGATASSVRHLAAIVYDMRARAVGDTRSPDKVAQAQAMVERRDWMAYYFAKGPLPQD